MRLLAILLAPALAAGDSAPKAAPRTFVSEDKGLTFKSPAGASYCPLPRNWVGSDHGTTLFLTPPKGCGRPGYASSARNFRGDPPQISVYYGLWFDFSSAPACPSFGTATLFGKAQPICKGDRDGKVIRTVWTRYSSNGGLELSVTLQTTPERENFDLATFRQFIATLRMCSTTYRAEGQVHTWREGPPCPKGGIF